MTGALGVETEMLRFFVAVLESESVTFTVKLDEPEAVGVPDMIPVLELRVRPEGKFPEGSENV